MNTIQHILRWVISRAANFTPNVTYFAKTWPVRINEGLIEVAAKRGGGSTPMTIAAVSMCCALHAELSVGDTATIDLKGVTNGGDEVGDFIVTVNRISA